MSRWKLHVGHALDVLATLPDASVHCLVTSPPYWGLRDYGDPGQQWPAVRYRPLPGMPEIDICEQVAPLGLEPDPYAYVGHLVAIMRDARRVLRDDGVMWLNIGDSYASGEVGRHDALQSVTGDSELTYASMGRAQQKRRQTKLRSGCKQKDLVGIPWLLAFALRTDGWYLRSEVIWAKPNPMPESVTDRPTKAHEQVFLFSKSDRYWYDADAVRTAHISGEWWKRPAYALKNGGTDDRRDKGQPPQSACEAGRNARTVWPIASQPYDGAHFATMPPALAERCIKAGCQVDGVVFDPFTGSGTTGEQALLLGRRFEGSELSESYAVLARERLLRAAERAGLVDAGTAVEAGSPVQLGMFAEVKR